MLLQGEGEANFGDIMLLMSKFITREKSYAIIAAAMESCMLEGKLPRKYFSRLIISSQCFLLIACETKLAIIGGDELQQSSG